MNSYSVVVPVHNKESFIKKTLESVISQTYTDFELILVNDGSTDKSGLICDEFALKDSRIKVIHQQNGGVSNARNNGVKAATNNLIAFLDADDFWNPDFLMHMNELIEYYPDVDIYSSKYATIQKGLVIENENYFPTYKKFLST